MPTTLKVKIGVRWYTVQVGDLDAPVVEVLVDGHPVQVEVERLAAIEREAIYPQVQAVRVAGPKPKAARPSRPEVDRSMGSGPRPVKTFRSPMPGVIISVAVKAGDQVVPGDAVCVLEAMKMQQTLRAEWAGVVKALHVQAGKQIQGGDPILELE
ncbi:MAG: hypothetical protein FJ312_02225 [SAR202 cluster bacterium]|nr:hypothetical protein [SAR202 cluster bacterium]